MPISVDNYRNIPAKNRQKFETNSHRYSGLGLLAITLMFILSAGCSPVESDTSSTPTPNHYLTGVANLEEIQQTLDAHRSSSPSTSTVSGLETETAKSQILIEKYEAVLDWEERRQQSLVATQEAGSNPDVLEAILNSIPEKVINNAVRLEGIYSEGPIYGSGSVIYVQDLKDHPDKQVLYISTADHVHEDTEYFLGYRVSQPHGSYDAYIERSHMGFVGNSDIDTAILAIVVDKGSHTFNPQEYQVTLDIEGKTLYGLGFTRKGELDTACPMPIIINNVKYILLPDGKIQLLEVDGFDGMSGAQLHACDTGACDTGACDPECKILGNISTAGPFCGIDIIYNSIEDCDYNLTSSANPLPQLFMNAAYAEIQSFD
jgi:hypothetical protein